MARLLAAALVWSLAVAGCATEATDRPLAPLTLPLPPPDPCAARLQATVVDSRSVDAHLRWVAVQVSADAAGPVTGTLGDLVDQAHVAARPPPPSLPPGPARDAPAHAPRDFLADLVVSAVVGLLDVTLVPITAIPYVLTGGGLPMVPFIEPPLLTSAGSLFDDALLDDDEWKAEVKARALRYEARVEALDGQIRALPQVTTCPAGSAPCTLSGFIDPYHGRLIVDAGLGTCPRRSLLVDVPPTTASDEVPATDLQAELHGDDAHGAGARAAERAWSMREAAAPAWSDGFPTPLDGAAAFSAARARFAGPLVDATLVCRVSVHGAFDTFGAPDPMVRVSFGWLEPAAHTFRAADDVYTAELVVPDVHLAAGEKMKLSVVDVDPVNDDWVGAVSVRYEGQGPLVFRDDDFSAECRVRTPEIERAARAASATRARDALKAREVDTHRLRSIDVDDALRSRIEDTASAGGWTTPEAAALVVRYDALIARWESDRAHDVDTRAKVSLELRGAHVEQASAATSFGPMTTVHLRVSVDARRAVDVARLAADLLIVDALGRTAPAQPTFGDQPVMVEPGTPLELELEGFLPRDAGPYTLQTADGRILKGA